MDYLPVLRCPGCSKIYLEHDFGISFTETTKLSFKCSCGWELDVCFEKTPKGFLGNFRGNFELNPRINVRSYK